MHKRVIRIICSLLILFVFLISLSCTLEDDGDAELHDFGVQIWIDANNDGKITSKDRMRVNEKGNYDANGTPRHYAEFLSGNVIGINRSYTGDHLNRNDDEINGPEDKKNNFAKFELIIPQLPSDKTELEKWKVYISTSGTGRIRIFDNNENMILSPYNMQAELDSDIVEKLSSKQVFWFEGYEIGVVTVRVDVECSGALIATDKARISVIGLEFRGAMIGGERIN